MCPRYTRHCKPGMITSPVIWLKVDKICLFVRKFCYAFVTPSSVGRWRQRENIFCDQFWKVTDALAATKIVAWKLRWKLLNLWPDLVHMLTFSWLIPISLVKRDDSSDVSWAFSGENAIESSRLMSSSSDWVLGLAVFMGLDIRPLLPTEADTPPTPTPPPHFRPPLATEWLPLWEFLKKGRIQIFLHD